MIIPKSIFNRTYSVSSIMSIIKQLDDLKLGKLFVSFLADRNSLDETGYTLDVDNLSKVILSHELNFSNISSINFRIKSNPGVHNLNDSICSILIDFDRNISFVSFSSDEKLPKGAWNAIRNIFNPKARIYESIALVVSMLLGIGIGMTYAPIPIILKVLMIPFWTLSFFTLFRGLTTIYRKNKFQKPNLEDMMLIS